MAQDFYDVNLDQETGTTLKVYLRKNVQNLEEIRTNIIQGLWDCAVIKPSLIVNPFQIAVAANKAVVAEKLGTMVTKTIYSEILFNLSLSKNITQSLSKFGIEKDPNLLICFLVTPDKDYCDKILAQITGDSCPISELSQLTSIQDVKRNYKLNKLDFKSNSDLLDVIVSRMVTKSFVSH